MKLKTTHIRIAVLSIAALLIIIGFGNKFINIPITETLKNWIGSGLFMLAAFLLILNQRIRKQEADAKIKDSEKKQDEESPGNPKD